MSSLNCLRYECTLCYFDYAILLSDIIPLQADGSDITVRSAYLITDNGYAKWRMMQCPIKCSTNEHELRWSTRLESVRKDVECFFGRLKARFRILHMRILFHQQYKVDNVFISSSILHNMTLVQYDFDDLDIAWNVDETKCAYAKYDIYLSAYQRNSLHLYEHFLV